MLFKGVVTLITRGFGQTVTLALELYLVAGVNTNDLFNIRLICLVTGPRPPTFITRV